MRLSNATLANLPGHVLCPTYDRSKVTTSILHLGIGAFHRAHQAVYTDAVLASGDLNWGIAGAGVISAEMKNALAPQDGLYTMYARGADFQRARVIGSITELLGGPEDADAVLKRMSDPAIRIVSITVTEKGYYLDPATGELNLNAEPIKKDLANPQHPTTILGLIVHGLDQRRKLNIPPFTVMSCDNLPSNGILARKAVIGFAREFDAELAAWIEREVCFPCTMVDRITPATTDADRAEIAGLIGMEDVWPVVTEEFTQWVIEDTFSMGRPDWTIGGGIFSNEIECWENMKLRCLNGAHSTLAYLGQLFGRETVASAMEFGLITDVLDELWPEIREVLHAPQGVNTADYVESLKQRFRNPNLRHLTAQIASDGSQKLPQRLLAPLRERIAKGLPYPAIATATAAWVHFIAKSAYAENPGINDPMAQELIRRARLSRCGEEIVANLLGIEKIFGNDLPANPLFVATVIEKCNWLHAELTQSNASWTV